MRRRSQRAELLDDVRARSRRRRGAGGAHAQRAAVGRELRPARRAGWPPRRRRPRWWSRIAQRRSHDLWHFRHAERLVDGVVSPPIVSIENPQIARRHVHAIALAAYERHIVDRGGDPHVTVEQFFLPSRRCLRGLRRVAAHAARRRLASRAAGRAARPGATSSASRTGVGSTTWWTSTLSVGQEV